MSLGGGGGGGGGVTNAANQDKGGGTFSWEKGMIYEGRLVGGRRKRKGKIRWGGGGGLQG